VSWNIPGVNAALLGFDAREMFMDPGESWDAARRGTYLLRTDVRKPLSVDPAVWPSLFGEGLPEQQRQRLGLSTVQRPDWRGPHQDLWDDLHRMHQSLGPLGSQTHWTIALHWVSADGLPLPSASQGPHREELPSSALSEDWRLLGFDIADAGLFSGLSNCGYDQATVAELRASWGAHLNEHHLFTNVSQALAFRDLTNRRVPEHAPFFVYALSTPAGLPDRASITNGR
jgi:hypothetical protein